jgi:hypothetical protein
MGATINENSSTFDRLQLVELERRYTEAKQSLTSFQIEQVEKGNEAMIRQFPAMGTAYAIYAALQRKRLLQQFDAMNRLF